MNKNVENVISEDEALREDVTKVGACVVVGAVVFRLSEVAINKSKSCNSSDGISRGDIERELEKIKNERDGAIKTKTKSQLMLTMPCSVVESRFGCWSYCGDI